MPMPVSATLISSLGPITRALSRTSPRSVYLIPLDSRLRRMLVRATSSVKIVPGSPSAPTITSTGLPSAMGRASPRRWPNSAGRSTSAGSTCSCPDSALATSSSSLTRASRVLPEFLMSSTWYSRSGSRPPSAAGSASRRVSPMMEFSGVRSSWLMLAQNLSLDSEAVRSRCDASSSSAYRATTPRLVCSSSFESSLYRAMTPRLVSCSSALSLTSWSFCCLRSSSAAIRSWFCRRSSSRADCGRTAASCSPTSCMSGCTPGGRRLVIVTTQPVVVTLSRSRAAAAIPSAGGSPSRVTVSSSSASSMPNVMTAVSPAVTTLRLISLSAVATRT